MAARSDRSVLLARSMAGALLVASALSLGGCPYGGARRATAGGTGQAAAGSGTPQGRVGSLPSDISITAAPGVTVVSGPIRDASVPTPSGPEPAPPAAEPGSEALRNEMSRIDSWLTSHGYERSLPLQYGTLAFGQRSSFNVRLESGVCYVAVAAGDETTRDLDLYLYGPGSVVVARDVAENTHPLVRFCAPLSDAYEVQVHMYSGAGHFGAALYRLLAGSPDALSGLFPTPQEPNGESAAPPPVPPPPGVDAEAWRRFIEVEESVRGRGFERMLGPASRVLGAQALTRIGINLVDAACYVFVSTAADGVQDLDISIYQPTGLRAAFDAREDRDAQVRYCPTESGTYQFEARIQRGAGQIVYAVLRGPRQSADDFVFDVTGLGLDANYNAIDRDLVGRGYEGVRDPVRGALEQSQTRNYTMDVEGERCYAVLAAGASSVESLALRLYDEQDREIDRNFAEGRTPLVRTCPERPGRVRIELVMERGRGLFVARPYVFRRGTRGAFGLTGLLYLRAMEMVAVVAAEGYQPAAAPVRAGSQRLDEQQSRTHRVRLQRGSCYAVTAVGGEGLHDVDLVLASPEGDEVDSEVGPNPLPAVRHCPARTGQFRLEVTARDGAGRYVYQLFRRPAEEQAESAQR